MASFTSVARFLASKVVKKMTTERTNETQTTELGITILNFAAGRVFIPELVDGKTLVEISGAVRKWRLPKS